MQTRSQTKFFAIHQQKQICSPTTEEQRSEVNVEWIQEGKDKVRTHTNVWQRSEAPESNKNVRRSTRTSLERSPPYDKNETTKLQCPKTNLSEEPSSGVILRRSTRIR
jgi:hypothetical protein